MHDIPPHLLHPLQFTENELRLLARTADALSAWLGKPVLGEVTDASETGYECVLFAIPLLPGQDAEGLTTVQMGGEGARLLGSRGGLSDRPGTLYLCEYLWGIQLGGLLGVRYIKVGANGEEQAWSDNLFELLPFDVADYGSPDDDSALQ